MHAEEIVMTNPEWGVKRVCPETGKRFYDLNKNPIVSPYTGKVVAIDSGDRRTEALSDNTKAKPSKAAKNTDDDLLVDDEDDAVEVDDDLLEDDDNDSVALDDLADVPSKDDD